MRHVGRQFLLLVAMPLSLCVGLTWLVIVLFTEPGKVPSIDSARVDEAAGRGEARGDREAELLLENAKLWQENIVLRESLEAMSKRWESAEAERQSLEAELTEIYAEIDTLNSEILLSYGPIDLAARNSGMIFRDMLLLRRQVGEIRRANGVVPPELREQLNEQLPEMMKQLPLFHEAAALNDDPANFAEFQANFFQGLLALEETQMLQTQQMLEQSRAAVIGLDPESVIYGQVIDHFEDQLSLILDDDQIALYERVMVDFGNPLEITTPMERHRRRMDRDQQSGTVSSAP